MMKTEVLGIRCGLLSERHRLWGECPMTDIDHLVSDMTAIEYNERKAIALIEYKYGIYRLGLESANIAATEDLASRAQLPFYVVQYDPQDWEFLVRPRNDVARTILPKRAWMTEAEFVAFLHRLRGKTAPAELLASLSGSARDEHDDWEEKYVVLNPAENAEEIAESVASFFGESRTDME